MKLQEGDYFAFQVTNGHDIGGPLSTVFELYQLAGDGSLSKQAEFEGFRRDEIESAGFKFIQYLQENEVDSLYTLRDMGHQGFRNVLGYESDGDNYTERKELSDEMVRELQLSGIEVLVRQIRRRP